MKENIIINNSNNRQKISAFSLTMIAIGTIVSIRTLPEIASYGPACIFTVIAAIMVFLIPILISFLELSIKFPYGGGIYTWAKEIFGVKCGFFEAYVEMITNAILMIVIVSFISNNILYLIDPSLINNKIIVFVTGILILLIASYINLKGLKTSAIMSSICTIFGVFIPMVVIVGIGIYNFTTSDTISTTYKISEIIPKLKSFGYWTSFTSVILAMSGAEVVSAHVRDVKNVKRDYTISLTLLALAIAVLYTIAPISITMIIPTDKIQFAAGTAQVLQIFFTNVGLTYIYPIMILLTCIGAFGALNSWIISNVKPVLIASEDGFCHKIFATKNKQGAPTVLMLCQFIFVTFFQMAIIFIPTANDSFWIFTVLCCQNTLIIYVIIFLAYFVRIISNEQNILIKLFKIKLFIVGSLASIFSIIVGFLPNPTISLANHKILYAFIILFGLIITWLPGIPLYLSGKNRRK